MRVVLIWSSITFFAAFFSETVAQEAFPIPREPRIIKQEDLGGRVLDIEVDEFIAAPLARSIYEVSGKGLAAVVIDTGLNSQHRCFGNRIVKGQNFVPGANIDDTLDVHGHGSHVSGIICGLGFPESPDFPSGIAIEASVVPLKVFGAGEFSVINQALAWVLGNKDVVLTDAGGRQVRIGVVNMSIGTPGENFAALPDLQGSRKEMARLIQELRAAGIVVTVSSGNSYSLNAPAEGMAFPAIIPATTSVGAVYDKSYNPAPIARFGDVGLAFTRAGQCTIFSQRLSRLTGGPLATDIFAPGYRVLSASKSPEKTRAAEDDGTSQAAPVAAGVALLLQQKYLESRGKLPGVDLIERCLFEGGRAFTDEDIPQMDTVLNTGREFRYLNANCALKVMTTAIAAGE